MTSLPPLPQQIGILDQFIARQPETLVLKEKILSLSGDSFDIKLANGQPILRVEGKVMSLSGRKSVFDMNGNHLFDIYKEHFHLHATYVCEDAQGNRFFELKRRFASECPLPHLPRQQVEDRLLTKRGCTVFGSKATATLTVPATGKTESLVMHGNWLDSSADIADESTGAVVARINRKLLSSRDIFFGQQTYALQVAPGADLAVSAGMAICFDELNNEK